MSTASEWYEKNKEYQVNVAGEPENGNEWNGHIYTYENHSSEGSVMIPELTISYYEGDNSTDIKTHVVKLIDPNSTAGTTMPVKRNNLYRIVLTKATKLDFDLQVLDWNAEEAEIEHPDVPLNLPKDVQDSLNRQLLVYDLFTENNVKSIDITNKTVEFEQENLIANEYPVEQYFTWTKLNSLGLCGNTQDSYLYVDGQAYQLPTLGQLQLLAPLNLKSEDEKYNYPAYTPAAIPLMNTMPFEEVVCLKNDDNYHKVLSEDYSDETIAFKGTSQLMISCFRDTLFAIPDLTNPGVDIICSKEFATKSLLRNSVCGIRFKGSNQCAAYKWQFGLNNGGKGCYGSIKIKALPNKGEGIEVYDITDNKSFWKEGTYIEVKIPIMGDYVSSVFKNSSNAFLLCTTRSMGSNYVNYLNFNTGYSYIYTAVNASAAFPIRLVKVKDTENESSK
ncbi:MAG: hypothetical protein HDR82_03020 [Bacteroides sp.]|nr:hypothetical protein [Bacteroides sp.]